MCQEIVFNLPGSNNFYTSMYIWRQKLTSCVLCVVTSHKIPIKHSSVYGCGVTKMLLITPRKVIPPPRQRTVTQSSSPFRDSHIWDHKMNCELQKQRLLGKCEQEEVTSPEAQHVTASCSEEEVDSWVNVDAPQRSPKSNLPLPRSLLKRGCLPKHTH